MCIINWDEKMKLKTNKISIKKTRKKIKIKRIGSKVETSTIKMINL